MAALAAASPAKYPFFLESVATGTPQSRYSLLLGGVGGQVTAGEDGNFLGRFAEAWAAAATARHPKTLPFEGGWFIYLGYELAGEIEPSLRLPPSPFLLPQAVAVRCRAALVYDHRRRCLFAVGEEEPILAELLADVENAPNLRAEQRPLPPLKTVEAPPASYLKALAKCRAYIYAGDIFQANLSRSWHANLPPRIGNYRLYQKLRRANPSPFAALATFADELAILSSSPERLVKVEGGTVHTRPIAGTRARRSGADKKNSRLLTASPKERAEHLMLLDLERNDLSKICNAGSVRVDELMTVESYRHVHHIVSNVIGDLAEGVTPAEVIRAVFPGGTITGCPKVRCMEILAESEKVGRGPYTGSLGYVCNDGDMDLNILIRSILRQGSRAHFRAGGGIVADSRSKRELAETTAKANGLIRALVGR